VHLFGFLKHLKLIVLLLLGNKGNIEVLNFEEESFP